MSSRIIQLLLYTLYCNRTIFMGDGFELTYVSLWESSDVISGLM